MRSAVELTSLPPVQVGTRILYVDTCAFLDLVRMPMRGRDPAAEFLAVTQILRAHYILRLTAEIVDKEFADNKEAVRTEVERHVMGVQESAARVASCMTQLGQPTFGALRCQGIDQAVEKCAQDTLSAFSPVQETDAIGLRANNREKHAIGPAQKGKACLKDCIIAETLLELAGQVLGTTDRIVFLTSNTSDFGNRAGGLHPDLEDDFTRLNIQMVSSWSWAHHSLTSH
jgi:hypothetical protein